MAINTLEQTPLKNHVQYGLWHDHCLFGLDMDARHCTRLLGELVVYPRQIYDLGRSISFQRVNDRCYQFEIRSKRYLGRGASVVSAKIVGTIEQSDYVSRISAESSQAWFYVVALIFMTSFVLISYVLVTVTILFLPLALLMSAVLLLHWGYLLDDRRSLVRDILTQVENSSQKDAL